MKMHIIRKILIFATLCIVIPLIFQIIISFYFTTAYTSGSFTEAGYIEQYESGIYKYRILSKYLMIFLFELLRDFRADFDTVQKIHVITNTFEAESHVYMSYFMLNTIFTVLSSIGLLYFISKTNDSRDNSHPVNEILIYNSLLAITQFVVVPYDNISYFLHILAVNFLIRHLKKANNHSFFTYLIILIIATTNRESSALILAVHGAIIIASGKFHDRNTQRDLIISICVWLITYFLLRLILGFEQSTIQEVTVVSNLFSIYNYAGLTFLVGVCFLLISRLNSQMQTNIAIYSLLFSLPYFLVCFVGGYLIELRLWMPVFLNLILTNSLNRDIFTVN